MGRTARFRRAEAIRVSALAERQSELAALRVLAADRRLTQLARRDAVVAGATGPLGDARSSAAVAAVLAARSLAVSEGRLNGVHLAVLVFFALASFEAVTPLPAAAQLFAGAASATKRTNGSPSTELAAPVPTKPRPAAPASLVTIEDGRFRYRPDGPLGSRRRRPATLARPPGCARRLQRLGQVDDRAHARSLSAISTRPPSTATICASTRHTMSGARSRWAPTMRTCSRRASTRTCDSREPTRATRRSAALSNEQEPGAGLHRFATGWARSPARTEASSRGVKGSASRSRGCCSPTRGFSSSTSHGAPRRDLRCTLPRRPVELDRHRGLLVITHRLTGLDRFDEVSSSKQAGSSASNRRPSRSTIALCS